MYVSVFCCFRDEPEQMSKRRLTQVKKQHGSSRKQHNTDTHNHRGNLKEQVYIYVYIIIIFTFAINEMVPQKRTAFI